MKNVMILIVFIFFGHALCAQDEVEQLTNSYEKQVGLNATNFFLRFVSFNQGLAGTPDILVLYKKGNDGRKWRYGFGGRLNLSSTNDEEDEKDTNNEIQLSYRFGREHYRNLSKRWEILYGWETHYRGGYSKSTSVDFNFNGKITRINSTFSLSTGIRMLGGIQFRINDRLSLLTETSYGISFFYRKSESNTERENQSDTESFNKNYSANTFFNAPLSIIVNYHF